MIRNNKQQLEKELENIFVLFNENKNLPLTPRLQIYKTGDRLVQGIKLKYNLTQPQFWHAYQEINPKYQLTEVRQ